MKHFRHILCVVQPEESGRPTLERAVSLAENNQARLTVVDVIAPTAADPRMFHGGEPLADAQRTAASERLQALRSFAGAYEQRVQLECAVLSGSVFLEVIRAVLRGGHDLVLKSAENPTFVERLFGSDDMHLLRKCPCPVWLTRADDKSNYASILAAVDFNPERADPTVEALNRSIIELACSLAVSDFAQLHLVHVWEVPGETMIRTWSDDAEAAVATYVEAARAKREQGFQRLREQLSAHLSAEGLRYVAPQFHLCRGRPVTLIPDTARQVQADLVVMGTVARTGIPGLFIGNTAEAILEQLQCSVLAVKPPGFESPVRPVE
jgi:nucleotide-binding universal stress UspA family protein